MEDQLGGCAATAGFVENMFSKYFQSLETVLLIGIRGTKEIVDDSFLNLN